MPAVSDQRQPAGTAFALREPLPWVDLSAVVRAAEQAGYVGVFLPEIAGRDALVTLGSLAGETRDLRLGTGVLPIASRTTLLTAMGAATVHERSNGRLILGLGTGALGGGALDRLREEVSALRALLAGGTADRRGGRTALSLVPRPAIPIWIAALGPRAMRLGGEIADGVLLNWCTPERVGFARARIAEGAEAAGRDPGSVSVSVYVRAWVGHDEPSGMSALRVAASEYASYPAYARQFEQMGLGEAASAARLAREAGRPEKVPDALVRGVCAFGPDAGGRLDAYRDAGADVTVVYPVPEGDPAPSIERTLLALAPS
jgi:alkanesulfonate monooxygenase SsuD/methylene tetrahydromethanopterin reductase-like flavin-dependent oxidoreductase (luciferase family)